MCYRVATNFSDIDIIKQKIFNVTKVLTKFNPRYNVAITQKLPVIVPGSRILDLYKWGLIPHWSKNEKIGSKLANARSETLAEKPAFKDCFKNKRCLVLVSGFFEWTENKTPFYISINNSKAFALAGLWDEWINDNESVKSCTIITCDPNILIQKIHNRMPVILRPENYEQWLCSDNLDELKNLLKPFNGSELKIHEVSKDINYYKNDYPQVLNPINKNLK